MLTQGWRTHLHHIEPLIEILAELPFAHKLRQVTVRRRYEPNITLQLLLAPDTHETAALQNTQQYRLHIKGHLTDLIQKERAPVRLQEKTVRAFNGIRERALLVSEETILQKFLRHTRTVERHERHPPSRTLRMNLLRNRLLARTAFTENENPRMLMLRHLVDAILQPGHLKTFPDQLPPTVTVVMLNRVLYFCIPSNRTHPARKISCSDGIKRLILIVAVVELGSVDQLQIGTNISCAVTRDA